MSSSNLFPVITINALTATADQVSVKSGVPLSLGQAPTANLHAANKEYVDTKISVVQTAIDLITGGSNTNATIDTFLEMQTFVENMNAQGVTNLTEAVSAEQTARENAIAAEAETRANAIATEALERANADTKLSNSLFKSLLVPYSTLVFPDESPPMVMPTTVKNTTNVDGWYFKNGSSSTTRKINWYLPAPVNETTKKATVGSLLELNIPVKLVSKVSSPFVTVYTKIKPNDPLNPANNNAASWYNAKATYVVSNTSSLTAGGNYLLRALVSGTNLVGSLSGFSAIDLIKEGFVSPGTMYPEDEILAISIGTNSVADPGTVECVIHTLNVFSSNGNYMHQFSNEGPMNKFLLDKVDTLYTNLGQSPVPSAQIA
jgi:hypothetical protein